MDDFKGKRGTERAKRKEGLRQRKLIFVMKEFFISLTGCVRKLTEREENVIL